MKVLIDENLTISVLDFLQQHGIDAEHVAYKFKGQTDDFIMSYVLENRLTLLTNDREFASRFKKIKSHAGVIRITRQKKSEVIDLLDKAVASGKLKNIENKIIKLSK